MTNKQYLEELNKKLDNHQDLSLLEHFDIVLTKLPQAIHDAKYRPDDERDMSDFLKGLTDETDYELTFDDKLYDFGV